MTSRDMSTPNPFPQPGGAGSRTKPESERGSASCRILIRKDRVGLVRKLKFQATLLRVTDPRSYSTLILTTQRAAGILPAYVFSVVGTSRCDVRAACSGATPSSVARMFVPPATTRAGTAQRAIPTIALNTYLPADQSEENTAGKMPAAPWRLPVEFLETDDDYWSVTPPGEHNR